MGQTAQTEASAFWRWPRIRSEGAWLNWVFCLPAFLAILGVALLPLARNLALAFTDARLGWDQEAKYVGLENFRELLTDPDWWHSVGNTLILTGVAVPIETVLGLGAALLLNQRFFGRGVLRAAMLIPWAIPTVVSARMWAWMFNDLYGVINELLLRTGLIHERIAWLGSSRLSLVTVIAVDVWKTMPFMALLILAALQSVPRSVLEAGRLDGATGWQRFRYLVLPLIRPGLSVAILFRTLDSLRVFDLPFVLTSNSKATAVMSVYSRQQLIDFQGLGYGSAASFLVFCVVAVVSVTYLRLSQKEVTK